MHVSLLGEPISAFILLFPPYAETSLVSFHEDKGSSASALLEGQAFLRGEKHKGVGLRRGDPPFFFGRGREEEKQGAGGGVHEARPSNPPGQAEGHDCPVSGEGLLLDREDGVSLDHSGRRGAPSLQR